MGGTRFLGVSKAAALLRADHDFENFSTSAPAPHQEQALGVVLDQVLAWSNALSAIRGVATFGNRSQSCLQ